MQFWNAEKRRKTQSPSILIVIFEFYAKKAMDSLDHVITEIGVQQIAASKGFASLVI